MTELPETTFKREYPCQYWSTLVQEVVSQKIQR